MCGIVGFNWQDENLVKNLGKLIRHRGPDQEGFYLDNGLSLGHQRLSILDLSEKGRQPMLSADGNIAISFNGEIFNFLELKNALIDKGYHFESKTDTEVLLYAYQEYGYAMLAKLNGQFAFCIYDKLKQKLFLARDRVGINPLYYYYQADKFIFGSELKVILSAGIKKDINQDSLNYYLMYGHTPGRETIINNCFKVEPAHFLVFDLKERKIEKYQKYWDFSFEEKITQEAEAAKLILEQLDKSVKDRLLSDVPVGAFLSGGVDSSAVVALMSKYVKNLNTFSVKFDRAEFDESKYAKIVSDKFGTKHHVVDFNASDVRQLIPKLVYHYDEPLADPAVIPTFLVSKVAQRYVKVSLTGDGSDELFGGYGSYSIYQALGKIEYLPQFLKKILLFFVDKIKTRKFVKVGKFLRISIVKREYRFAEFRSLLYKEDFNRLIKNGDREKYYKEYVKCNFINDNYLREALNIDTRNYLPENCLAKVDRSALGNSLETRPPFLDHQMLELSARISMDLKIKNKETKYILKKALEGVLPKEILYRSKQGFAVPLKYYFRNELKDLVEKYVINYDKHDLYKKELIDDIKDFINDKEWVRDYSRIIFPILMFNLWYDKWILGNIYGE